MEVLYKKLYDKYNNLKVKRISQLDDANEDLERRFQDYLNAADAYVDQLKCENEKLRADIGDLRNEVALLSSSKDQQYEDIQKLLSKERQKNEELTKEIDNLLKLQREGTNQNQETNTPRDTLTRKRRRISGNASDTVSTEFVHSGVQHSKVLEPAPPRSQENIYHVDHQQPQSCRSPNDSGLCNCLFQDLSECLTGMKFSVDRHSNSVGMSALHQSSGYSFKLTWVNKPANEETEFLYHVSSLGTFERVAPEFMRESIVFSFRMCPVFFERVSRFIKHL